VRTKFDRIAGYPLTATTVAKNVLPALVGSDRVATDEEYTLALVALANGIEDGDELSASFALVLAARTENALAASEDALLGTVEV
jgi:hypothetical protein